MKNNKFYIIIAGIISILTVAMMDYGDNIAMPYWWGLLLTIITLAGVFSDD